MSEAVERLIQTADDMYQQIFNLHESEQHGQTFRQCTHRRCRMAEGWRSELEAFRFGQGSQA